MCLTKIKNKLIKTLKKHGLRTTIYMLPKYIYKKLKKPEKAIKRGFKDILIVSGCSIDHPHRYRVLHQKDQLLSNNVSCDDEWYEKINMSMLKHYRGFIFYRCPITEQIRQFITEGKKMNKTFYFDVDDLVIDRKYVSEINYLNTLPQSEYDLYMNGVDRMNETLSLCDYAITTTEDLAQELRKYVPGEVFVNRNVASEEMNLYSSKALNTKKINDDGLFRIGYLSGSITHNADFEIIKKSLIRILNENENVRLVLVGHIDLPNDLKEYKDKIEILNFVDWKKLPEIISTLDLNLAPLEDTLFNRCKSENKWTEAALVKVPTLASNVGAFKKVIVDNINGYLAENNEESWYQKLNSIISDKTKRYEVANTAHTQANDKYITTFTGKPLANFILGTLKRNIAFLVPGTAVSGGMNVILKHAATLRLNNYDVLILNCADNDEDIIYDDGLVLPVITIMGREIDGYIDQFVATLWTTVRYIEMYPKARVKSYLVQGYESYFGKTGDYFRKTANSTYSSIAMDRFLTISKWCQDWLSADFNKASRYCQNGINLKYFTFKKRDWGSNTKIRILVEGNCEDEHKNVDESFNIINKLSREKFEVWYLSYGSKTKDWYITDKTFNRVPYSKVGEIYSECHILLKSSKTESFAYPPIEMMATGGVAVVAENEGGIKEYLKDDYNCLIYKRGDIDGAVECINRVLADSNLRDRLINNGLKTAQERDWKKIEPQILNLYESN